MSFDDKIIEYVTAGAGSLNLTQGEVAIIRATNAPEGQTFKEWKIEPIKEGDDVPDANIDDKSKPVARVTMGSKPALIKAVYEVSATGDDPGKPNQLSVTSGRLYETDADLEKTIKDLEKQLEDIKIKLGQEKNKIDPNFRETSSK